jgi:hypothetical protein
VHSLNPIFSCLLYTLTAARVCGEIVAKGLYTKQILVLRSVVCINDALTLSAHFVDILDSGSIGVKTNPWPGYLRFQVHPFKLLVSLLELGLAFNWYPFWSPSFLSVLPSFLLVLPSFLLVLPSFLPSGPSIALSVLPSILPSGLSALRTFQSSYLPSILPSFCSSIGPSIHPSFWSVCP